MTFSYKFNGDGSLDVISGSYLDKIGKWSGSGDELCFELSQDTPWMALNKLISALSIVSLTVTPSLL